jgi:arylformamidase
MIRMSAKLLACLALTALVASGVAAARAGPLRKLIRARIEQRLVADKPAGGRDIAYGTDSLQNLRFWAPAGKAGRPAPLLLFVHGGGWRMGSVDNATGKAKVEHYTKQGYAFVSIDYRLVPAARVEDQATDVASALSWIVGHAGELKVDPRRIVLMGHSAGAHLVALVGTDPRYLHTAGLSERAIAGIIPIDGAAYDVPTQMTAGPPIMGGTYAQAFGTDPARQAALSPTRHAAAPNAPAFLILHVQRSDGIAQAQGLAKALQNAGTAVQVERFPGTGLRGHVDINRKLGLADYPATAVVDAWLKARLSG